MTNTRWMVRSVLCGLLAVGLLTVVAELTAQVTKGKSRPLRTHTLMEHVVKAHCGALKQGLDGELSSDEAWDEVAEHAELLNEAGHILMADGRCPDGDWAKAAKALQDGSAAVAEAIGARDAAKAKESFASMTQACAACHKAHRKSE